MINSNKRMYLTNRHRYVLSNQQDTGSMNIKGKTWENNKIQKHFDGTNGDNTAIVFKNLTKKLNMSYININLMQFNTFSTQVDIRSLSISINESSKGYLKVTYGLGNVISTETLVANLPNTNSPPSTGSVLTIANPFTNLENPFLGNITLEPQSNDLTENLINKNSFRGVVTLTYKIANKLQICSEYATCKIYFLPYSNLSLKSINGYNDFIKDMSGNMITYPNPMNMPTPSFLNEHGDGTLDIPFEFANSFETDDSTTFVDEPVTTPNQIAIQKYIANILESSVLIPNRFNYMYFQNTQFKVEFGKKIIQMFNVTADKNIHTGKIVVKSGTTICDTHDDILLNLTFDNSQNIGYIKTIYSDIAPLVKVLSIIKPSSSNGVIDLMSSMSSMSQNLNFDQTVTVIIKNQSDNDIQIKVSETLEVGEGCDSSSIYDLYNCNNSLLYDNCHQSDELYVTDNVTATTQTIAAGNYAVYERVLFSPVIWEASGQTKIVLRKQSNKKHCCK